ncbi:MAG: LysR family transcriptional regulator [Comamonadaceae bacterium]|nr:LysR family transcriptional regulator [Comamonadaceae bacterium]
MSLPPLNAIRVFEAIGRTGSVKAAADELFVTPGAASRQLAKLEQSLEVPLFKRSHRQITLTPAGLRYFETVSELLVQLSDVTDEIRTSKGRRPLHIWCPMTFGQRWLVPRLQAFRKQHPDRVVIFTTSLGPIDRNSTTTDVAIRIGRGSWPGCVSHRLMPIRLTPVCSPALLEQVGPFNNARDLLRTTLLQSSARPGYWRIWLDAAGAKDIDPDQGITFESVSLAYQMAISGAGVSMGQAVLVADDLSAKRLVAPFPLVADSMDAFYLIYPNRLAQDPFVCQFRDWILEEATDRGLHTPP